MPEVLLPAFSEETSGATVVTWFFDEGNRVQEGDELVEIMADQVTYKIVADTSGILKNIQYRAGDEVRYLEKLADIEIEEE